MNLPRSCGSILSRVRRPPGSSASVFTPCFHEASRCRTHSSTCHLPIFVSSYSRAQGLFSSSHSPGAHLLVWGLQGGSVPSLQEPHLVNNGSLIPLKGLTSAGNPHLSNSRQGGGWKTHGSLFCIF